MCNAVFFISFQSLKTVGKYFRSPWKVLEFYTNLPVWILSGSSLFAKVHIKGFAVYSFLTDGLKNLKEHSDHGLHCLPFSFLIWQLLKRFWSEYEIQNLIVVAHIYCNLVKDILSQGFDRCKISAINFKLVIVFELHQFLLWQFRHSSFCPNFPIQLFIW